MAYFKLLSQYSSGGTEQPQKISFGIICILAEIRLWHFLDTRQALFPVILLCTVV
jgi:hypothetical protein